ncbi:hypothetical protein D3C80_1841780 [compost metagenome]
MRSFGGVALNILQHIKAVDFVKYLAGKVGVFIFQRDCDNARLFAALARRHIFLILQNSVEATLFGNREQRTSIGVQSSNL